MHSDFSFMARRIVTSRNNIYCYSSHSESGENSIPQVFAVEIVRDIKYMNFKCLDIFQELQHRKIDNQITFLTIRGSDYDEKYHAISVLPLLLVDARCKISRGEGVYLVACRNCISHHIHKTLIG